MSSERVEIPEHEHAFVQRCVDEGRYADANAVVAAGLRLLEQLQEEERRRLERLRAEVHKGMDDLENGRYTEINSVEELEAFMDEIGREAEECLAREGHRVSAPEV